MYLVQDSDWHQFFDQYHADALDRYWVFNGQGGLAFQNFDNDHERIDQLVEECHPAKASITSDSLLIDQRKICFAIDLFTLDEWTYLIGFQSDSKDLERITKIIDRHQHEPEILFTLLPDQELIWMCHIDGWWEVWTYDDRMPNMIHPDLTSMHISSSYFFSKEGDGKRYYGHLNELAIQVSNKAVLDNRLHAPSSND